MRPVTPFITMPSRRMAMHDSALQFATGIHAFPSIVKQSRSGYPVAGRSGRAWAKVSGDAVITRSQQRHTVAACFLRPRPRYAPFPGFDRRRLSRLAGLFFAVLTTLE